MIHKHKTLLTVFLFVLLVFRIGLSDRGHFFNPDEQRYLHSLQLLLDFKDGKPEQGIKNLFVVDGRPGFVLMGLIPASIQLLAGPKETVPSSSGQILSALKHPAFFDPVSYFNAFVTFFSGILFYLISIRILKNRLLSVSAAIVLSLLCNTNLYIRHLVPYDWALFLFLLALYLPLRRTSDGKIDNTTVLLCGGLSVFGLTVYPGFYMFVFINAAVVFFTSGKNGRAVFWYSLPFAGWFAILEVVSQLAGKSFILDSLTLADTVLNGSFSETLIFLPKYLLAVEGAIGVFLLTLFVLFIFRSVRARTFERDHVIWIALLCYLAHGILGTVFHKFVFYGRVLHMYMPFLVLGAFRFIDSIKIKKLQCGLLMLACILSLISFNRFAREYFPMVYPREVAARFLAPEGTVKGAVLFGVNLDYIFPITEEYAPETYDKPVRLYASFRHPITFPGYMFDNYSIEGRKRIQERKYPMNIYIRD